MADANDGNSQPFHFGDQFTSAIGQQAVDISSFAVVHVAETIRGGIATYLREVVALQAERYGSDRVAVIAPNEQLGDLGHPNGVLLVGADQARWRLCTAWRIRGQLRRLLGERPTQILHVHSAFAGMVCRAPFMGAMRFDRLIYCPHGWAFTRTGRSAWLAVWVERGLSFRCDAIVCISTSEKKTALRYSLPIRKLRLIYNGLRDREPPKMVSRPRNGAQLRLLFVGRLDRQKGFDVLIAALQRVKRDVKVDVFGGAVLGRYPAQRLPDSIRMHGWQDFRAIEPLLLECDALVMPSRWEGLPLSAIEAMRAGKPIIASCVGGLAELVEDRVTGRLVAPEDAKMLAQVLNSVQPGELAAMGRRARRRFLERFSIEQCESSLADLYSEMLME